VNANLNGLKLNQPLKTCEAPIKVFLLLCSAWRKTEKRKNFRGFRSKVGVPIVLPGGRSEREKISHEVLVKKIRGNPKEKKRASASPRGKSEEDLPPFGNHPEKERIIQNPRGRALMEKKGTGLRFSRELCPKDCAEKEPRGPENFHGTKGGRGGEISPGHG